MPGVRFAPSPTGRFHVGNLRTAWLSHLIASSLGEPWIVRFEDIDRLRVATGSKEDQLGDLRALGLKPARIYDQSSRAGRHFEIFGKARALRAVYACYCSRKEVQDALAASASAPHGTEAVYNGKCREGATTERRLSAVAWRIRGDAADGSQDFIIGRTSDAERFAPAYHWACAIDDRDGGYRLLVRAWDLESAAVQQRAVHALADRIEGRKAPVPAIFHCSLVTREDGGRLEKRTQGVTRAELEGRGITTERLIAAFVASLEPTTASADWSAEARDSRIWGELRRTISVTSLGL